MRSHPPAGIVPRTRAWVLGRPLGEQEEALEAECPPGCVIGEGEETLAGLVLADPGRVRDWVLAREWRDEPAPLSSSEREPRDSDGESGVRASLGS